MGIRTASAAVAVLGLLASGCVSSDGPPIPPAGFTSTTSPGGDPIVAMPVRTENAPRTASAGAAAAFPASAPTVDQPTLAPPVSQPNPAYRTAAVQPVQSSSAPVPAAAPVQTQPAQPAVASIRFTPVIGAPIEVVRPLSSELAAAAQRRGVAIRTSSDVSSDNILRGYFSALNDGSETTVLYVWDVLDNAGNRLHRIQGKETIPGKPGDPWASVPASTMQAIANRTIDAYLEWHNSASS